MGNKEQPDEGLLGIAQQSITLICEAAVCSYVECELPVQVEADRVRLGQLQITSRALAGHLLECDRALVFAMTLGEEVDKLLQRYSLISSAVMLGLHAAASASLQGSCDRLEREVALRYNGCIRQQISPGCGDFAIETQEGILRLLGARNKIGLSQTSAHMLVPVKSVTAAIGIGKQAIWESQNRCISCQMKDCIYRRENNVGS